MADFAAHDPAKALNFLNFSKGDPETVHLIAEYLGQADRIGSGDMCYVYNKDNVVTPCNVNVALERHLYHL